MDWFEIKTEKLASLFDKFVCVFSHPIEAPFNWQFDQFSGSKVKLFCSTPLLIPPLFDVCMYLKNALQVVQIHICIYASVLAFHFHLSIDSRHIQLTVCYCLVRFFVFISFLVFSTVC